VALENAEMLAYDAMLGEAPEIWACLTTRSDALDQAGFYRAREYVMRALKRQFPRVRYAAQLEYTTGEGERAGLDAITGGGIRRPHWNLLFKGIPAVARRRARRIIVDTWCRNVDASKRAQFVGEISDAGGLIRYVSLHFAKAPQAPPEGFSGQRFSSSRDYFTGCTVTVARKRAREALSKRRAQLRGERAGLGVHEAELAAHEQMERLARTSWVLVGETGARLGAESIEPESLPWRLFEARRREQWRRDGVAVPDRGHGAELLRAKAIAEAPELARSWSELDDFYAVLGFQLRDLQRLTAPPAPALLERTGRRERSTLVDAAASCSAVLAPNPARLAEMEAERYLAALREARELGATAYM
jgi:hypothetical protein